MVTEHITYGIKPTGHNAPENERKHTDDIAVKKIMQAMEAWLDAGHDLFWEAMYTCALDTAKRTVGSVSTKDIHAALMGLQHHPRIKHLGWFISALYNLCDEQVITFDLELPRPPDFLGYNLAADKIFVNKGTLDYLTANQANAMLINYGKTEYGFGVDGAPPRILNYGTIGRHCGHSCDGDGVLINLGHIGSDLGSKTQKIVINYGSVEWLLGYAVGSDGIVVNVGDAEKRVGANAKQDSKFILLKDPKETEFSSTVNVLWEDQCKSIPALYTYFENIRIQLEAGRDNVETAIKVMKSLDPAKMRADLKLIVDLARYTG